VRIGLSGKDVNIRYVRVPRVPDWQLRNLMRFEVAEIGDQSGSEVASDFNLLPEMPEIEGEDVVVLAMARESMLEAHLTGLASVGGKLDAFSPSSLALYNAFVRYGVVQDETVLIADIGHENVDVVLTRGSDLLFARNLSGGSRLFDDAVAQRFGVDAARAEKLKIELASLRPGVDHPTPNHERASQALLAAAGQMLSLLSSTVLFAKSQVKVSGLKLDRVLLCGGGAALDGLPEYVSAGMGVPVELFDPFRVVDTSALPADQAEQLEDFQLEAVVALGLATMASDPAAYSIEVLPARVARRREFLGGTLWLVAAAVLAVLHLGHFAFSESRRLDDVRVQSDAVAARLRRAESVHSRADELAKENAQMAAVAGEMQAVLGSGEQIARTLGVLDRHLPGDFWVQSLIAESASEPELGIESAAKRPIIELKGSSRPGTEAPAVLWQSFVASVQNSMPGVRLLPKISATGDSFRLKLSLLAPPLPAAEAAEAGEGAESARGGR
jgi:Tfp pilus assembly PilM family ATPase